MYIWETYFDENGEEQSEEILAPWTTIKKIMETIRERSMEKESKEDSNAKESRAE